MEERDQGDDDKTEEATDERRKQFQEQGNIASPRELLAALALSSFVMIILFAGSTIYRDLTAMFGRTFSLMHASTLRETQIMEQIGYVITPLLPWMAACAFVLVAVPVSIGLTVTRFHWSSKKIEFNLDKLNPTAGIMRMFGFSALGEAGKSLLKLVVISSIMYIVLKREVLDSPILFWKDAVTFAGGWGDSTVRLLIAAAISSVVYGVSDYGYNLFKIEREMMMSKKDLKDEIRGQEGDPHVKSARRRMARDFATRKGVNQAQNATFIVTNPTHYSVAIRYVKGMPAPIVVAKGQDFLAFRIREIAKKHDIEIVENKPLARTLYKTVKVGQEVPSSMYTLIIEVMKFIYRSRGRDYFEKFGVQPFGPSGQRNNAPNPAGVS